MEETFKPGDKVCHKANPSIPWIIEKIENEEAFCSTLTQDNENKKQRFALVTIEKYEYPQIIVGSFSKRDKWHY